MLAQADVDDAEQKRRHVLSLGWPPQRVEMTPRLFGPARDGQGIGEQGPAGGQVGRGGARATQRRDRPLVSATERARQTESDERHRVVGVHLEGELGLSNRLVVAPAHQEHKGLRGLDGARERVEHQCRIDDRERLVDASHVGEELGVPKPRLRRARVRRQGPLEVPLGGRPIPDVVRMDEAQRRMRLRQFGIEVQGLVSRRQCQWQRVGGGRSEPDRLLSVGLG
jgi:hypothetical protein